MLKILLSQIKFLFWLPFLQVVDFLQCIGCRKNPRKVTCIAAFGKISRITGGFGTIVRAIGGYRIRNLGQAP
jgi:hypothetical protein